MSRQQRRAAERATRKRETKATFTARVHGEVMEAKTVQGMWNVYAGNRFGPECTSRPLEPEHLALLREVFYAGATSMMHLITSLPSLDDPDDEAGAWAIQRLAEELETYADGRS